ncbi:UNVERIFIED_CONTAM: hypothetical protein NCL1_34306 [Trichonephila clavipes]
MVWWSPTFSNLWVSLLILTHSCFVGSALGRLTIILFPSRPERLQTVFAGHHRRAIRNSKWDSALKTILLLVPYTQVRL